MRLFLKNDSLADQILRDGHGASDLSRRQKAILVYAEKLTRQPQDMTPKDIEALREEGLDDAGILRVAQVAAYFSFVNRMAKGLGVELETGFDPGSRSPGVSPAN